MIKRNKNTTKKAGFFETCTRYAIPLTTFLTVGMFSQIGLASSRDVAFKLFSRLNGVPPSAAKLDEMSGLIDGGKSKDAALAAINDTGGMFYNLTVKNFAARWSNTDRTPRQTLNDFIATVVGMVHDDVPFNTILSGDLVYTSNVAGAPPYSLANNTQYENLDTTYANLATSLQKVAQTAAAGVPPPAATTPATTPPAPTTPTSLPAEIVAGVMTTRGFAEAYYSAGTNRRAVAFLMQNFVCKTLEQLNDTTRSDFHVRRDVTRAPGDDSSMFRNRCAGCHSGMDAFGGAFAFLDWDDTPATKANPTIGPHLFYTPGEVRPKFNRNGTEFPEGFVTVDANWINNWLEGPNSKLGWKGPPNGTGPKSFGEAITSSDAFATCMAKQAVEAMCLREAVSQNDLDAIDAIAQTFKAANYSMKDTFANAAVYCTK